MRYWMDERRSKFVRPHHLHIALICDHRVVVEKIATQPRQQVFGDCRLGNDLDLDISAFDEIGGAFTLPAAATHIKSSVAMRATFMQNLDNPIFQHGFANDGDEFHGMQVHGGSGVKEFRGLEEQRNTEADVKRKCDGQCGCQ